MKKHPPTREVTSEFRTQNLLKDNESAIFETHGCALLEQFDSGKFYYRAVNMHSGKSISLGHRATKLPISKFETVASQIAKCAASNGWVLADAKHDAVHNKARLNDILQTVFRDILPLHGFPPRDAQNELSGEILDALCGIKLQLAEAEVGIGKTLAYLLPTALIRRGRTNSGLILTMSPQSGHQKPIVIATSSIALQRAIEQEYIPTLSDILIEHNIINSPLTSALRKGKNNYICEQRLANFTSHANRPTRAVTAPLMSKNTVDLASVKGLTPYIKRNICVNNQCGNECPKYGNCRYMRHLTEIKLGGYDFQVCNHNYLLADILHRSKGLQPLLPDYQAIVIDEAHKFLDAARGMYSTTILLSELLALATDIESFAFEIRQSTACISREISKIQSKSQLIFNYLIAEVSQLDNGEDVLRNHTTIREKTKKLIIALKNNIDMLFAILESRTVTQKFTAQFNAAKRSLCRVSEALNAFSQHENLVYWLEGDVLSSQTFENMECTSFSLCGIPKNLGELLYRDLWSINIPIILASGTLSASGCFSHIKKKLGVELVSKRRLSETSKPSPFNYRDNTLLYISENVPFPKNKDPEYIAVLSNEVRQLVNASHGHAAVLFTSYMAMDMVYNNFSSENLHYPLFRLTRSDTTVIEQFKNSGNGVLFASGAIWEGIDIPGDILSMLIIPKLPFSVPDPVSEWEQSLYVNMEDYKTKVLVPEMLVKLKQGFGRLIRTVNDSGVVAILDSRAGEHGSYRNKVLEALPNCKIASDVCTVANFFHEKKSPTYFDESNAKH